MSDRDAVVSAISSTKNLGQAAHKLGASRRTLQNRMRRYGIPRGRSGRPLELLPYKHAAKRAMPILGIAAGVVSVVLVGRWLFGHKGGGQSTAVGGGLDLFGCDD